MEPIILHIELNNTSISEWLKENEYIIYEEPKMEEPKMEKK